jgi:DNA-binding LytR/AlgR family response regulator
METKNNNLERIKKSLNSLPASLDENINNLFNILYQYFQKLNEMDNKNLEHIKLITDVMDKLIYLKENEKNYSEKDKEFYFNKCHKMAYDNLNKIYDLQKEEKEQDELNKKIEEIDL